MTFEPGLALVGLLSATPTLASGNDLDALLNRSSAATSTPPPDPTHVSIMFGKDIAWKTGSGMRQAMLFGDSSKSDTYGVLIEWLPGPIRISTRRTATPMLFRARGG